MGGVEERAGEMSNLSLVDKAKEFAKAKHWGQVDDSGFAYFNHVAQVARIISDVTDNDNVICAAYLHDTIEDCAVTHEMLVREFNQEIADLVYEVTHEGKKDEVGYYFPRLKTRDAILIKFADRLSNLSRMEAWDKDRQEHYLRKSKFWNQHPELIK